MKRTIKCVMTGLLFLALSGVPVSALQFEDFVGGGNWNSPAGPVQSTSASGTLSGLVPAFTVDGTHLWGDLHGNNSTGYGMWLSNLGGGGGFAHPAPSGSTAPAWVWYDLAEVYPITEMWIWNYNQPGALGRGLKDVTIEISTNNTEWTTVYTGELAQATGEFLMPPTDKLFLGAQNFRYIVISADTNWGDPGPYFGLSEVRWYVSVPYATQPKPQNTEVIFNTTPILEWFEGSNATAVDGHDVYFGTNFQEVADADTTSPVYKGRQSVTTYDPGTLDYGQTYYWRIDELNDPDIWPGNVWTFSVSNYLVIDDFNAYAEPNDLTNNWDVLGGASIAISTKPAQSGNAMEFTYTNSAAPYYSDVQKVFAENQDWLEGGVFKSLSISFAGRGNNSPEYLAVIVEDADGASHEVQYDGDAADITLPDWREWKIPFTDFTGVDFSRVKKLTLRVGDTVSQTNGKIYIDDIRRYITRCLLDPQGDVNGDCIVDIFDFASFGGSWLTDGLWP